jgi:hypothetical protein
VVKVMLPSVQAQVLDGFEVGHKVVKRAGERWPRDVRGGEYQVIP